jgi:hypothetical protein
MQNEKCQQYAVSNQGERQKAVTRLSNRRVFAFSILPLTLGRRFIRSFRSDRRFGRLEPDA